MTACLLRFVADTPFGEPTDETVVVEQWPLTGFNKGFTLLGVPGTIAVTFDPPLVPAGDSLEAR